MRSSGEAFGAFVKGSLTGTFMGNDSKAHYAARIRDRRETGSMADRAGKARGKPPVHTAASELTPPCPSRDQQKSLPKSMYLYKRGRQFER